MNKNIQSAQQYIKRAIELLTGGMDIRMQRAKKELYEASAALQLANIQSKEAAPGGGGCFSVRELLEGMREDLRLGDTLTAGQRLEEALKAISPAANTRQMELAQEIRELANERQSLKNDRSGELYLTEQQLINAAIDLANVVQPVLQDEPVTPEPAQVERALQDLSVRIVDKNLIGCIGQVDGGAADRALMVARRLLADGQWDGVSQLDIVNPYDVCLHIFSHGMADHKLVIAPDPQNKGVQVVKLVLQDDPAATEEEDESLLWIMYGDERDDPLTVEEESALYWCPGCGLPYADCNCPEDEITKEVVVEPELSKAPIVIPEPILHHWHYVDMAFVDRTSRVETNSLQHAHEVAGRKDVVAYRILDQRQNNAVVFDNGYEVGRIAAEMNSLGQLMKVIAAIKGADK